MVRDSSGSLIDCFGKRVVTPTAVFAETLAVREACIFYRKAGICRVIIEGDYANVLNWCVWRLNPAIGSCCSG